MCFLANTNLEPSLVSPVQINPVVPWPAFVPYFEADNCTDRSEYPAWTINNLTYDHTTPRKDANSTVPLYGLSFNLTNLSNNETLPCFVRVDETTLDRTHSERWVDCAAPGSTILNGLSLTSILFDKDYNLVAINQTWKCNDTQYV